MAARLCAGDARTTGVVWMPKVIRSVKKNKKLFMRFDGVTAGTAMRVSVSAADIMN
jgi:hypothetical protein